MTYYISASNKVAAAAIQADVGTAVSIYNMWQTEKIGRDINPSYLIHKVMEAGVKRVVVESPVFTVLNESTVARTGAVTVKYGGVEDD
jgi:phage-related baseplate assembly protein